MKIRNGFVSNSSTTSFCIVGVEVEQEPEINLWDLGLTVEFGQFDEVYIGRGIGAMQDDQTMGEFKSGVAAALTKAGIEGKPSIIVRGYYNG